MSTIINERLASVKRIIAVSGGKGGVGKSTVAAGLALILSRKGYRAGLLDLDFYGPSTHLILGMKDLFPEEDKGLIPPELHGIRFMSIVYFIRDESTPFRGIDISNAITELLVITRWGDLDILVIDMPPGVGDTTLDLLRHIKRAEFLLITTPSLPARETMERILKLLKGVNSPILGIIENMKLSQKPERIPDKVSGIPVLGSIRFDRNLESALGDPERLMQTSFMRDLKKVILSQF